MTKLIHHSPLGALEIPGVLGAPEPGEPFDIDDDLAAGLLEQSIFELAPAGEIADMKVDDLRTIAADRGIDATGMKKADIVELLTAPAEQTTEDDQTAAQPAGEETSA